MTVINDPALYRKLSEPKENLEAAKAAFDAFYKDLREIREKHGIPDLVISYAANYLNEHGKESAAIQISNCGDSARSQRLILELVKPTRLGEALLELIEEVVAANGSEF
jgi:hypothetical protein